MNITRNPNFRRWFGISRVVDASGQPLVVYHGTQYDVTAFDPGMMGDTVSSDDVGFFFTNDPVEANAYASWDWDREAPIPNVMPVYLSLQNPLIVDISNRHHKGAAPGLWYDEHGQRMAAYALASGYDGLVISDFGCGSSAPRSTWSGKQTLYVAFEPTQIKSAIGNSGAFDPTNPDLCDRAKAPAPVRRPVRPALEAEELAL